MNLVFKKCTIKDLEDLVEISKTTFISAFEKDNNEDDFRDYMNTAFSTNKIESELSNPNSQFYFTYLNDERIGYFKLNSKDSQTEKFNQNTLELERIYVLDGFQGQQIGNHMLLKVIEIAKAMHVSVLWLGVWEKNVAAIRFYERLGFKKFNKHPYYIGTDKQTDWLMQLDIV